MSGGACSQIGVPSRCGDVEPGISARQVTHPLTVNRQTIDRLKDAMEQAREAADDLEGEQNE